MENSRPPAFPNRKRRKAHNLLWLTALLLVGLLVAWWRHVADDPVVTIPNPVMPHPNAFDFYVTAGRSLVNPKQIDDASYTKPTVPVTPAQKETLLRQNASVFQSLRQGFAYEYRNPPIRSNFTPMPQYATFRRIARLLALQNKIQAMQGDWGGAADSALDAIRLGEDVPHGGGLMAHGAGIACEMIGQRPMWKTIEHLSASQSRAAAQRLEAIMERHFPFADTIQEEKWTGVAELKELFHFVKARTVLVDANGFAGPDASASRRYSTAFYLLYGKKRVLQNYTEYMDAIAVGVRKPYALKMLPPPVPDDPINEVMLPVTENLRYVDVEVRAQNGILLVALALHAYRLEHGRYPASLAELAPAYLKKVPDDPFALQGSYAYRGKGASYLLYSIGPDGKDDGGKPIDDPKRFSSSNPKWRYNVEKESQGDIVAGVNTP